MIIIFLLQVSIVQFFIIKYNEYTKDIAIINLI